MMIGLANQLGRRTFYCETGQYVVYRKVVLIRNCETGQYVQNEKWRDLFQGSIVTKVGVS